MNTQGYLGPSASDPDYDPLTFTFSQPAHGTIVVSPPYYYYTPAKDYVGADSYSYTASDGRGGTSGVATGEIIVTDPAHRPLAQNDGPYVVPANTQVTLDVLANDGSPDGGTLRISSITKLPQHGQAAIVNGSSIVYQPQPGYVGQEVIYYAITDNHGVVSPYSTAAVYLYVQPANQPLAANDDKLVTLINTAKTIAVLANDTAPDRSLLTLVSVTTPAHGGAVIANGQITYTPTTGYTGADSFSYTVSDGRGGTASAKVWVTVGSQLTPNQLPHAVSDTVSVAYGTATAIDVLANDSDPDGDPLTIWLESSKPQHGSIALVAGKVVYTPAAGYSGTDQFGYIIADGGGGSSIASVFVTVRPPGS